MCAALHEGLAVRCAPSARSRPGRGGEGEHGAPGGRGQDHIDDERGHDADADDQLVNAAQAAAHSASARSAQALQGLGWGPSANADADDQLVDAAQAAAHARGNDLPLVRGSGFRGMRQLAPHKCKLSCVWPPPTITTLPHMRSSKSCSAVRGESYWLADLFKTQRERDGLSWRCALR